MKEKSTNDNYEHYSNETNTTHKLFLLVLGLALPEWISDEWERLAHDFNGKMLEVVRHELESDVEKLIQRMTSEKTSEAMRPHVEKSNSVVRFFLTERIMAASRRLSENPTDLPVDWSSFLRTELIERWHELQVHSESPSKL